MANYTLDGAKIDVGTRKFSGDKGYQLTGTTYIRVTGSGTFGQKDFLPTLELVEIVKPYSEFLPTDSEGGASGKRGLSRNFTTVLASHVLMSKPDSVEACRQLCDETFNMAFLKSEKGQALVRDLIGQKKEFASAYEAYLNFVKPPEHKLVAIVETLDNKTMLVKDEETGKLKLPMAVRCDRAETLSVGFNNCFMECRSSVRSLRLRTSREHGEFMVKGLRDSFRAVSAFSEVTSDTLSLNDPDLVGVTLPKDERQWDKSIEARVDGESLLIIKAFRERNKALSEEAALAP